MISREEIAKKLRGSGEWLFGYSYNAAAVKAIGILRDATDSTHNYATLLNRLADLIDPTCRIYYTDTSTSTPDTGYEPDGYYSCSCCGELDDCFQEMWDDYQASGYEGEPPFRYCPHCGARVVRDEA